MSYEIKNGIFHFNEGTPEKVMQIMNDLYHNGTRIRLWYGDKETGKSYNEENDIMGTIGGTTGKKIPILIHNSRSYGGGAISCDAIVKIVDITNNRLLYIHHTFSQSKFQAFSSSVLQDGETFANCKSNGRAERLADFMNGVRNSK